MHGLPNLNTLHVSDCLSVHHQESKTVHTASGICHTDSVAAYKYLLLFFFFFLPYQRKLLFIVPYRQLFMCVLANRL